MSYSIESLIEHFLKEKGDEVIQIQIMERKSNGRGVFFVDFKDNVNVDCYYLPFHDRRFPAKFMNHFRERVEDHKNDSVLFFVFYYENKEQLLELDIDTNNSRSNTSIEVVSEK